MTARLRESVERQRADYDQKESAFHGLASRKNESLLERHGETHQCNGRNRRACKSGKFVRLIDAAKVSFGLLLHSLHRKIKFALELAAVRSYLALRVYFASLRLGVRKTWARRHLTQRRKDAKPRKRQGRQF